jgi:hypothetical protein
MNYTDKYNLDRKQSVFLAKKKWDENIYCGMKMENRNVTFPQTQTILNGVNVGSVTLDDIQAILNMRDAWKHLFSTINIPLDINCLCQINGYVARNEALEWGVLRNGSIGGISGTDYIPPIPDKEEAGQSLAKILNKSVCETEKAIELFLWGTRKQLFWDGNKRTSLLAANKILINGGKGLLIIAEQNILEFNKLLTQYYNSGDNKLLKKFLYNKAIIGLTFTTNSLI